MSQKSNIDKKRKELELYFLGGCVLGVVLGIVGMALYLIANDNITPFSHTLL